MPVTASPIWLRARTTKAMARSVWATWLARAIAGLLIVRAVKNMRSAYSLPR